MRENRRFVSIILLVLAASITVLPSAAPARGPLNLRAFALWVQPDIDFNRADAEGDVTADADGALGFGVSGEYQFSDHLGLELGVFRVSPDINLVNYDRQLDFAARATDGQAMTPVSLALDIHLLPQDRLDLYVAPFVAYVYYGDLEFFINETIQIDGQTVTIQDSVRVDVADDLAYGGTLGVDIPFSHKPWAISTSLRYLVTALDITDPDGTGEKLDFDSWMVSLGIRYSF